MGFWSQYMQRHPEGAPTLPPPPPSPYGPYAPVPAPVPPGAVPYPSYPPPPVPPPYSPYGPDGVPYRSGNGMPLTPDQIEQGFQATLQTWQGNPRGAAGEKLGPCPHCGSPRFFSRTNTEGGGLIRGIPPAPHCADCGYPVLQAGSSTGSSQNRDSLPVHQARMLPARTEPFRLQLVR